MKKFLIIACLLFSIGATAQVEDAVPAPPNPAKLVVDFTKGKNFITSYQLSFLEDKLVAYDDSTSNQVAIVIVETLKGYSANEFATALGRKWGIGGKQNNNGVVILISTEPGNRDAYIAVGYGLEGAIPDITAKSIVDNFLIPNLKNGDHFRALDETTDAIIKAAAGEYTAPTGYGNGKNPGFGLKEIIIAIIVIGMIIISVVSKGNNGGGYASRRGYRGWWGPTTWGGGGWSGGSGGGGGGFGGFGGGSFGGGGSGGKW